MPLGCNRGAFSKQNIEAFRLAGYSTWTGEAVGSNPAFYTIAKNERFVSVMANITDCRSVATGSIPVRTAKIVKWCNGNTSVSEIEDDSSILSLIANVGSSLYGKVAHCECEEQGSIPGVNQCDLV